MSGLIGADAMVRKISFILTLPICFLLLYSGTVFSSWLIEPARFHASAHGQLSCQDCHEDIGSQEFHPDPRLVNMPRTRFFSQDHCLSCHDEVEDNLAHGVHGRKKVKNKKKYTYCIRCHNPHYQMRIGPDRVGHFKDNVPRHKQCSACHEAKKELPPFADEDRACIKCHVAKDLSQERGRKAADALCLYCHAKGKGKAASITSKALALIDLDEYRHTPHSGLACIECHRSGAAFNHNRQPEVECLACHVRHDEKIAHDAHLTVQCGACHLAGVKPFRDKVARKPRFEVSTEAGQILKVHDMPKLADPDSCKRCHFKGNELGAAASVLPAKSVICMGCHASSFSIGDTTTIVALGIFLIGVLLFLSYVLSGRIPGDESQTNPIVKFFIVLGMGFRGLFSSRFPVILKTLLLDVFLQRRLYRRSEGRWLIHALIFYPFVFRFTWGMVGLLGSLWSPSGKWVWSMLDKNNMVTAFAFDLSGILLLLGVLLALCRETIARLQRKISLPEQDPWPLLIIGGIVIVGFIAEGIRMAMTGLPGEAEYALVGYWISGLLSGVQGLSTLYVYVWYAHAILVGAFVAYIPFSRLFHIIMAPIALAVNAGKE